MLKSEFARQVSESQVYRDFDRNLRSIVTSWSVDESPPATQLLKMFGSVIREVNNFRKQIDPACNDIKVDLPFTRLNVNARYEPDMVEANLSCYADILGATKERASYFAAENEMLRGIIKDREKDIIEYQEIARQWQVQQDETIRNINEFWGRFQEMVGKYSKAELNNQATYDAHNGLAQKVTLLEAKIASFSNQLTGNGKQKVIDVKSKTVKPKKEKRDKRLRDNHKSKHL